MGQPAAPWETAGAARRVARTPLSDRATSPRTASTASGPRMVTILLVIAGLVVPLVWGWLAHWLVERLWPASPRAVPPAQGSDEPAPQANVLDYQI